MTAPVSEIIFWLALLVLGSMLYLFLRIKYPEKREDLRYWSVFLFALALIFGPLDFTLVSLGVPLAVTPIIRDVTVITLLFIMHLYNRRVYSKGYRRTMVLYSLYLYMVLLVTDLLGWAGYTEVAAYISLGAGILVVVLMVLQLRKYPSPFT